MIGMTFGPESLSCSGGTTRSKCEGKILGSCNCTVNVAPFDRRLISSMKGMARQPQPMARAGHGGSKLALPGPSARRGAGHCVTGKSVQGRRGWTVLSSSGKPTASARPRAWLMMPARPSVTTQVTDFGFKSFTELRGPVILLLKSAFARVRTAGRNNLTRSGCEPCSETN